jgi:hypothetical protein
MPARTERGFALPLTLFVVVLITMLLAAAFVRAGADRRLGESDGDMVDALTIAQSGLAQYLEYYSRLNQRPADGDSVFFASIPPGGTATVTAHVLRMPTDTLDPIVYLVQSRGTRIDPAMGAAARARRVVTQFAEWRSGSLTPHAAFVAVTNVDLVDTTANRGRARGHTGSDGAGVLITVGADQSACGRPAIPDYDDNGMGSATRIRDLLEIDWIRITTEGYEADYTTLQDPRTWSSYFIDGDLTLDVDGSGLLVVTGVLTTTGASIVWDGVVIVGDSAVFGAGTTTINGMLYTGLDRGLIGQGPGPAIVDALTTTQVYYHGCNVDSAMTSVTGFAAIPNTWLDRWMAQ